MDPFTVALAVFGVQKLRGKSTGRSFRDALLAAGGVQLAGMGGVGKGLGAFTPEAFGSTSLPGATGTLIGGGNIPLTEQFGKTFAGEGIMKLIGESPMTAEQIKAAGVEAGTEKAKTLAAGKGFLGLGTGEKLLVGATALPLVASAFTDEEPPAELPPGFKPEDYLAAKAPARQQLLGVGERADYMGTPRYTAAYPYGLFNQGGIVNALPKFSVGGINYLPSKVTHDENDINNYNRTNGYVEDGTGNGNKDEDTILAQLADGEFVSRADAILGAGILEGASPNNQKDMRKKGAAFFYDQQAKLKRIFDLLDASRKTIN